jgi:hypothetical protein
VIGDSKWSDYSLSADMRIVGGSAELGGRFACQDSPDKLAYRWIMAKNGAWKLNYHQRTLAFGAIKDFDAAQWHAMKIEFHGDSIRGYVDGKLLADVKDATRSSGMAFLGSSYDGNLFDNVRISD